MKRILKRKPSNAFAEPIKQTFNLISFKTNEPLLLGSSSLSSQLYNNDYDLFETVFQSDNSKALTHVHQRFKKMIEDIHSKDIYFLDFKLGLDDLLIPTSSDIRGFYKLKYKEGLITKEQVNNILDSDENNLDEEARLIYTLRWSPKEIKQGYKELSNGRREYFVDALKDKAIIKLDIAYYVYDQFIEFSNIYQIYYGNKTFFPEIVDTLKDEMKELLREGKYFKYIKRLFSVARINRNEKLLEKLVKLLNSNFGLVYKVASQLNTMIDILDKGYKPIDKIHQSLQYLKQQLSYVYEFNLPKDIFEQFDRMSKIKSVKSLSTKLSKMTDLLMKKVNQETSKSSVF